MHMKGTSGCCQRVMHDPEAQHPGQMLLTPEADFGKGGKLEYPVRLRSTETNP